ncbi:MAG: D-xylose ABC transporter ATP-binding protein [Spirochaetaceae bacterium 4572_59]|nr:MAG: D-xylose ABC transporter ATP-binding protein [Spirochaetaceae bacterium 4572_59]
MENNSETILEMDNICKSFPGVKALNNVSIKFKKRTVHTLMGENGAGKSTLMKVLSGIYQMDSGTMRLRGEDVIFQTPASALNHGIAMVHQELSPIVDLSVAENMFVGREPVLFKLPVINRKEMNKKANALFEEIGIKIDPKRRMGDLSVAEMQMVEIAKAISYDAEILILDEPTSAISDAEVSVLFKIIRNYTQKNKAVIYISHKMEEIFQISDEITVLRDGEFIGTNPASDVSEKELIKMMVGRNLNEIFPKTETKIGDVSLRVENLSLSGKFSNISFEARRGEILGIAGLMGAGRSELVESIFGVHPPESGSLYINGKEVKIRSPEDAIDLGMALITEDRKLTGLNLKDSVKNNVSIVFLKKLARAFSVVDKGREVSSVEELIKKLSIKTPSRNTNVSSLSGGNQQKVVIAKWLLSDPNILILDEPTRGIDVGAKAEVHKLMNQFTEEGKTVIMISSEMPEIMGMSDRLLVLSEGKLTGHFQRSEFDQEKILACAMNHIEKESN